MSYYVVKPPRRPALARIFVVAGAAIFVLCALAAGWAAAQPVTVTVDGQRRFVRSGATIADLNEGGALAGRAGRLVGVDGSVVSEDGGAPPAVTRNGKAVRLSQRLYSGDVITSSTGADRRESLIVTDVPLPFATRYEGTGPLTEMSRLGAPGLRRVTMGAVSGVEVTSTVLSEPSDMVILRTRPAGKVVALTFDDGPWPGQTERVLDVLEREQVRATFFLVGAQVVKHPELARQLVARGHAIGNHTYGHKRLIGLKPGVVRREIRAGSAAIERVTGQDVALLRPPYGAMDSSAWREARKLEAKVVLWDVDSRDWTKPGIARLAASVVRSVRPGSVVLMHDGGGDRAQTARAVGPIIRRLKRQGYSFVTVDELAEMRAEAARKREAAAKEAAEKKAAATAAAGG